MRQRNCAALLLCGPLVAGCGAVTPMNFSGRPRPASPVDVSVWSDAHSLRLDPSRVRPGPVLFNITNQSGRPERFAVTAAGGRLVARSPAIAAGQTGQLKANLHGSAGALSAHAGVATVSTRLNLSGPRRTGNDELTQP